MEETQFLTEQPVIFLWFFFLFSSRFRLEVCSHFVVAFQMAFLPLSAFIGKDSLYRLEDEIYDDSEFDKIEKSGVGGV